MMGSDNKDGTKTEQRMRQILMAVGAIHAGADLPVQGTKLLSDS